MRSEETTKLMLAAGIVAGPLFHIVPLIEMFVRPGFDMNRHAISMLSLGDRGWIMISTFVVSGLLAITCAIGMGRALAGSRGGRWGPLLAGVFGAGMVAAGIFSADPGMGFPPGAPEGMPASMSWHAVLHGIAFMVTFLALIVACFVFARGFALAGRNGWAAYCAATGVATPALIVMGMAGVIVPGVAFFVASMVAWLLVVAVAMRLSTEIAVIDPSHQRA